MIMKKVVSMLLLLTASSSDCMPGVVAFSANTNVPFYAVRQEKGVVSEPVKEKKSIVPATPASFFAQTVESPVATTTTTITTTDKLGEMGKEDVTMDVSVPYDAAALLAYRDAGEPGNDFATFETRYRAAMVERVKSKARARAAAMDLRVPYDAAAALAFDTTHRGEDDFAAFRARYEVATVERVKAKVRARRATDLSVPYNAAAKLAFRRQQQNLKGTYHNNNKHTTNNNDDDVAFAAFEVKYKEQTIEMVRRKAQRKMAPVDGPVVVRVIEGAATSHEDDLAKVRHLIGFRQDLDLTLGVITERLYK